MEEKAYFWDKNGGKNVSFDKFWHLKKDKVDVICLNQPYGSTNSVLLDQLFS